MSTRRTFPWWLAISAAAVATAAPKEPPAAQGKVDPDTLLRAINFALLGTDTPSFKWKSAEDCVVISVTDGTAATFTEVLHLNNVNFSRISIRQYQLKYSDHVEDYVEVGLHGEDVVRESTMEPKSADVPHLEPGTQMEYTYKRQTKEYERMVRAWKYIYSHGCRSARSSF
jgi:hypothetical protein